jgi:hypothetical protein
MKRALPSRTLLLALLMSACAESAPGGRPAAPAPQPAPGEDDLWSLIPAESDLALWADMAKLRVSPWTRDSFSKVMTGDGAVAAAGVEQVRDVERLVFAKVPTLGENASLLVAQGNIDRERLTAAFSREPGMSATTVYRGADLVSRGDESLAFVGKRTVVSGLTIAVRAAIDCNFGVARAIDGESWFKRMRTELLRGRETTALVTALFVRLPPATREALLKEMGEGGALEEFGGRIDLTLDLDATAIGVVRTESEARDLAGRLGERIRDARVRPIVAAFGFAGVLDSVQLRAQGNRVYGTVHVSRQEREDIAARMAAVAELMAKMHKAQEKQEQQAP